MSGMRAMITRIISDLNILKDDASDAQYARDCRHGDKVRNVLQSTNCKQRRQFGRHRGAAGGAKSEQGPGGQIYVRTRPMQTRGGKCGRWWWE